MSRRTPALARLAAGAALLLAGGLVAVPQTASAVVQPAEPSPRAQPARHLDLPDGFQPEGIAVRGRFAYLGSRADGDLVRLNLETKRVRTLAEGPGTPSLGLKADARGRLFVAGGTGGDLRVVDARTGRLLRSYRLTSGTAFVNDVLLTKRAVWVTDSASARLYKLPLGRDGALPRPRDVERLPLRGAWEQVEGTNANGLTTTPDGRALLVVNSTTGRLYRVPTTTGRATRVRLGGQTLANGDGMLREGRRLFVVQNRLDRIAVVRLDADGRAGTVARTITSRDFDVPATVARRGGRLYLPNARFTTEATPETGYWVSGVRVPRHG